MNIPTEIIAMALSHAKVRQRCVREDLPAGIAVVHDGTRFRFYNDDAWERPSERPFLPWSPPPYPRLAVVYPNGNVVYDPSAEQRQA